jgi:hypothetical protein
MQDLSVSPSALAYLYGDQLEDLFVSRARLSVNETLPCREVKLKKKDLAAMVGVAALVGLLKEDCLRLSLGSRGAIIKSKHVLASRSTRPTSRFAGLEAELMSRVTGKDKDDGVASIVARVLGDDSADPWGRWLGRVRQHLLEQGYFTSEQRSGIGRLLGKELVPQCDRIAAVQPEVRQLRAVLAAYRAAEPQLYEQLWKDVTGGITSRQSTADIDLD